MKRFAFALLALGPLVGCAKPHFDTITSAPPGAVAEYHEDSNDNRWIDVTEGTAVGISCEDKSKSPCGYDGTFVADASIASVYHGYSDFEDVSKYYANPNNASAKTIMVVVGLAVGSTTLRVRTGRGDYNVTVNVKPAPSRT